MSWLRNSPLRNSFSKQRSRDSPPKDADPVACYDSFRKHWQQSYDIICHSLPPKNVPSHDDVLGVVNHVDHMITLLRLELRDYSLQQRHQNLRLQQRDIISAAQINTHCSPCLEHLLSENLLEKLHDWSTHTGRFGDAVRLEQLKLYELLISHDSSLLAHEPVTRPLLHLLDECAGDIMPTEVQKKLVVLLNYMCVALVQNTELLGLFFRPMATGRNRFIIFTLLLPFIHRDDGVGQQARDAMLLCMSLSKKNDEIGNYIAEESHICPMLATGLGALYSILPRTLDVESEDWHRLTVDDINDIPPLTQLMNSLEFCNAVTQVVHPLVQNQLLEFLYRGFLVPVMGPALLQESIGLSLEELDSPMYRTSVDELVAATAYFDLFLRSVTEPGLLRSLIRFLLEENYDDTRILDHLIKRIASQQARLSLVTLALFESLVDLNCEDVMLELCLSALAPCSHVMLSQRRRLLSDLDPFGRCAEKFLSLTPSCCCSGPSPSMFVAPATFAAASTSPLLSSREPSSIQPSSSSHQQVTAYKNPKLSTNSEAESLYSNYYAYLRDARQKIAACQMACSNWSNKYEGEEEAYDEDDNDLEYTNNQNGNSEDEYYEDDHESSVYNNSHRHSDLGSSSRQISSDSNDAFTNPELALRRDSTDEKVNKIIASFTEKPIVKAAKKPDSLEITSKLSPQEREKLDAVIAELLTETVSNAKDDSSAMLNSLSISGGESSGYESFAFKGSSESTPVNDDDYDDDDDDDDDNTVSKASNDHSLPADELSHSSTIASRRRSSQHRRRLLRRRSAFANDNNKQPELVDGRPPSVGVFLDVLLKKLECMTENNVYVNLHLTGLISRLAIYSQPLLQSFLLNHSLVFQPSIKYLFQVIASLKHKIDGFTAKQPEDAINVLVEQARVFLISRENRLVNARKNVLEAAAQFPSPKKNHVGGELIHSNSTMSMPTSRALEPKRRSLTSSLTQMFRKSTFSLETQMTSVDSFHSNDTFSNIAEEELSNGNSRQNARNHETSAWENSSKISRTQNIVICAVILDEWLKELAAIIQEHAIVSWFNAASAAASAAAAAAESDSPKF